MTHLKDETQVVEGWKWYCFMGTNVLWM